MKPPTTTYNFLYRREVAGSAAPRFASRSLMQHQVATICDTGSSGIFNVEFSGNGDLMAATCDDDDILLLDPRTRSGGNAVVGHCKGHTSCVNCARWLDGHTVVTGSDDNTVRIFDTRKMACVKTMFGHTSWVKNVERYREHFILSSAFDGTVRLWDLRCEYPERRRPPSRRRGMATRGAAAAAGAGDVSASQDGGGAAPLCVLEDRRLYRMALSPDASTMVISFTGGLNMIIHDLDIEGACAGGDLGACWAGQLIGEGVNLGGGFGGGAGPSHGDLSSGSSSGGWHSGGL
eukprot:jgi/Mesvir1/11778/Mv00145-RA.1